MKYWSNPARLVLLQDEEEEIELQVLDAILSST